MSKSKQDRKTRTCRRAADIEWGKTEALAQIVQVVGPDLVLRPGGFERDLGAAAIPTVVQKNPVAALREPAGKAEEFVIGASCARRKGDCGTSLTDDFVSKSYATHDKFGHSVFIPVWR